MGNSGTFYTDEKTDELFAELRAQVDQTLLEAKNSMDAVAGSVNTNLQSTLAQVAEYFAAPVPAAKLPVVPVDKIPDLPWTKLTGRGKLVTDWNSITEAGPVYGINATNAPFPGTVGAVVERHYDSLVVIARDPSALFDVNAWRYRNSSGVWSGWRIEDRRVSRLVGLTKGTIAAPSGEWATIATSLGSGENKVLDSGYVYGAAGITVPRPGYYQVNAQVATGSATAGTTRGARLRADNAATEWTRVLIRIAGTAPWAPSTQEFALSFLMPINTILHVDAYQNSGATVNCALYGITMEYRGPL